VTTELSPQTLDVAPRSTLTEAWLDAVFAASRVAVICRVVHSAQRGVRRRKVLVLTGHDIAQLRWMLRLRTPGEPVGDDVSWSIELRNTRARVAMLQVWGGRFVHADDLMGGACEIRDGETLARWLDARGFHAPFEAWKNRRGCVRSERG
jgi:hypothetical protein